MPKKCQRDLILAVFILFIYTTSAQADFSGKYSFTSNYIWRGVSQTQNHGAVQGELYYNIQDYGFYVGILGSNVDFGETYDNEVGKMPPIAHVEFDYVIGYGHSFNEDWSIDIGLMAYDYPGASNYDYKEWYGSITYKFLTANFSYTNNNFNTSTVGYYSSLGAKYEIFKYLKNPLLHHIYLNSHIGYFKKNEDVDGGSYTDYLISVIKEIKNMNFELGWTDTSGRKVDDNLATSHVYAAISMSF